MAEMVMAKRLRGRAQLQELLHCYLSLNPGQYHGTIIAAFRELCAELAASFDPRGDGDDGDDGDGSHLRPV
jgi:uncharacterized protein (TIGR01568 family)